MYSDEIERIDPTYGVSILFHCKEGKCITLPRKPIVYVDITTYVGTLSYAKHYYATFKIKPLDACSVTDPNNFVAEKYLPEEAKRHRIDIRYKAKNKIYGKAFTKRIVEVKEGEYTIRFTSIEDVIKTVESEFKRIFPGWILKHKDLTWEQYKKEFD